MTDEQKMMPCPFRGEKKELRLASTDVEWMVCDNCDAEGPVARALPSPTISSGSAK